MGTSRSVAVLTAAVAAFAWTAEGVGVTEPCTKLATSYHVRVKDAVDAVAQVAAKAESRIGSTALSLLGGAQTVSELGLPIKSLNFSTVMQDLLLGESELLIADISSALAKSDTKVGCSRNTKTGTLLLSFEVDKKVPVSFGADLDTLPDLSSLGITTFGGPLSFSGTAGVLFNLTVSMEPEANGAVGISFPVAEATFDGTATLAATTISWKDVASATVEGSISVSGGKIGFFFPSATGGTDLVNRLAEVRVSSKMAAVEAQLPVALEAAAPVGQLPSPIFSVVDDNVFDSAKPQVSVDVDITGMEETILGLLEQLGKVDLPLNEFGLTGVNVPGLTDVSQLVSGFNALLQLRPVAEEYFLLYRDGLVSGVPTFKGLTQFLKQAIPVPQTETSMSASGVVLTGGWYPDANEVSMNVRLEASADKSLLSLTDMAQGTIGDMEQLQVLFDLLGVSSSPDGAAMSFDVPDFSTEMVFEASAVIDVTLGLNTQFINDGVLTGKALALNSFMRVNEVKAFVNIGLDPINFETLLPGDVKLGLDGGLFKVGLGFDADFSGSPADDTGSVADDPTSAPTTDVEVVTEITLLQLQAGGATAVLDFLKQLKLVPYASIDTVLPVELTTGFTGDQSLIPVVELHHTALLNNASLPSFSLDMDLSMLVPSLPRGRGEVTGHTGSRTDFFKDVTAQLGELLNGVADVDIPIPSLSSIPGVGSILSGFKGKVDFFTVFDEYVTLLSLFRELNGGLSMDLTIDTTAATELIKTTKFQLDILGKMSETMPSIFGRFDTGLLDPDTDELFDVLNYLSHFQYYYELAPTIASADNSWGVAHLARFMSLHPDFTLSKKMALALKRLSGVNGFDTLDEAGFPIDASRVRFNPLTYLSAIKEKLKITTSTFNLNDLSVILGSATASLGDNTGFQQAIFDMLSARFSSVFSRFSTVSGTFNLPMDSLTGEVFSFMNFLPEVGTLLGLGEVGVTLADIEALFGRNPTVAGFVRYLQKRLLNGMELGITVGPVSFDAGVTMQGGRTKLALALGLDFAASATPSKLLESLKAALTGILDLVGADSVVQSVGNIGQGLDNILPDLDSALTLSASMQLNMEAGLDVTDLISSGAAPTVFAQVNGLSFAVQVALVDYDATLDFGSDDFKFELKAADLDLSFGVSSNATEEAPAVIVDGQNGVDFSLGPLVNSLTMKGSLDARVPLTGGILGSNSVIIEVADPALFDLTRPKFSVDVTIPRELVAVLQQGLSTVSTAADTVRGISAFDETIPLVNRSLNGLLKSEGLGPDWADFLDWKGPLETLLEQYPDCVSTEGAACPTARELLAINKEHMQNLTRVAVVAAEGVPPFSIDVGQVGGEFQIEVALNGRFEIAVTPPIGELIDEDDFEFTGTGFLQVGIDFSFGMGLKVNASAGLSKVTSSDISVAVKDFKATMEVIANVDASVKVGILSASVSGGNGNLTVGFEGTVANGDYVPLNMFGGFVVQKAGSLDACLPFTASIGGADLGQIAGGTGETPQICVRDAEVFVAPGPNIEAKNMDRLFDFRGFGPMQVLGVLRGLANFLGEFRTSPVFDLPVPLTDIDLGDILDFTDEFTTALTAKLVKPQPAADRQSLSICIGGNAFLPEWNVSGGNDSLAYLSSLDRKVLAIALNLGDATVVSLDESALAAAVTIDEVVISVNHSLYQAGLHKSVEVNKVVDGEGEAIELCTLAAVQATDLETFVSLKKTGKNAYNDSEEAGVVSVLGIENGALVSVPRVPSFSNVPELVEVLAVALGLDESIVSVTFDAYVDEHGIVDNSKRELMIHAQLPLVLPSPAVSLALGAEVEPLLEVDASADFILETTMDLSFDFGVRLGASAGNLSVLGTPSVGVLNFTIEEALTFDVLIDKVAYPVSLAKETVFIDELETNIRAVSALLASPKKIKVLTFGETFLIQTFGAKRLELRVSEAFETATGLGNELVKTQLFEPAFRNVAFSGDVALKVSDLSMSATFAVLEAAAYDGNGEISAHLEAAIGTDGRTVTLQEMRTTLLEDPFGLISANATLKCNLSAPEVIVGVPKIGSVSAAVEIYLNPPYKVSLAKDFALPNGSNFVIAVDAPALPNLSDLRNLSLSEIVGLIRTGVDIVFGSNDVPQSISGIVGSTGIAGLLDKEIPIAGFTAGEVITEIQQLLAEVETVLAGLESGNLNALEDLIEGVLKLPDDNRDDCYKSCLLEFEWDTVANAIITKLNYELSAPVLDLAFELDLEDLMNLAGVDIAAAGLDGLTDMVDVSGQVRMAFKGKARLALEVGATMTNPPQLFIGGGTGLFVDVWASASGELQVMLGPFEFGIDQAAVSIDADGVPGVQSANPATFSFSLTDGVNYPLSSGVSNIIGGFGVELSGKAGVSLQFSIFPDEPLAFSIPSLSSFMRRTPETNLSSLVVMKGNAIQNLFDTLGSKFAEVSPIKVLLTDKEAMINGLNSMLTKINLAITGAEGLLGDLAIPMIGDKLREGLASKLISRFQDQLITKVTTFMNDVSCLGGEAECKDKNNNMATFLAQVLHTLFNTEMEILLDAETEEKAVDEHAIKIKVRKEDGTDMTADVLDPVTRILNDDADLSEADAVEWNVLLGTTDEFTDAFEFDLGLDDNIPLELNMSTGVSLLIGWRFRLFFGMSLTRGFYLNVEHTEAEVFAGLSFPDLEINGKLIILEAAVKNRQDATRLFGSLSIDVGDLDADNYLTFKEIKSGGKNLLSMSYEFAATMEMDMTLGVAGGAEGMPRFKAGLYTYLGVSDTVSASKASSQSGVGLPSTVPSNFKVITTPPVMSGTFLILDVTLDLGKFVTELLNPIFGKLSGLLKPLTPILDALGKPLPVISDIAKRDVSLFELPEMLINGLLGSGGPVRGYVTGVLDYLTAISDMIELIKLIIEVVDEIATNPPDSFKVEFGDFEIGGVNGFSRYAGVRPGTFATTTRSAAILEDLDAVPASATNQGSNKMKRLLASLTDSGKVFYLPFLSASGVMKLITGDDVDLFIINSPTLDIDVVVDFWIPLGPWITIDIYGAFRFKAHIAVGYDTSGIRRAVASKPFNPLLALDGFFISDTDTPDGKGVDVPELYSKGVLKLGATLNLLLVRASAEGRFSFEGSVDLFDPNDDGKIRFSEIKSIIEKGSFLDIFNIKIKMCAGATLKIELFNPFVNWKCKWFFCWPRGRWDTKWSYTKDVCFLEIDTTPEPLPILAPQDQSTLRLNVGPNAGERKYQNTKDFGEYMTVRHVDGTSGSESVEVLFGTPPSGTQEDNRLQSEFQGIGTYDGQGGRFGDTFLLVNPVGRGSFSGDYGAGKAAADNSKDRLIFDWASYGDKLPAGTIEADRVTGFGLGAGGVSFDHFEEVVFRFPDQTDTITVTGSPAGAKTFLYLNGGSDRVSVTQQTALDGELHVVGGNGQDTLVVQVPSNAGSQTGSLTEKEVKGLGIPGRLFYSEMELVIVDLGTGDDQFVVESTVAGTSVSVKATGGADTITVGAGTVNNIRSPLSVTGDHGKTSTVVFDDTADTSGTQRGYLTDANMQGLGLFGEGVLYSSFGSMIVKLSTQNKNVFEVRGTHFGSVKVMGGDEADELTVSAIKGPTTVLGGSGADTLAIPLTLEGDVRINTITSSLTLDGQLGDDHVSIGMAGTGTSRVTVTDSGFFDTNGKEKNTLEINGTPFEDQFLIRYNFIALIHNTGATRSAERIDMDRGINNGITINGHDGADTFASDSTSGIITLNGGAGDDRFLVGQLYNAIRDSVHIPGIEDVFNTTRTTEGYLSDGNNFHLNANGEAGEDTFVVMRNKATLSLRGGVGNDRFTVRAFALWDAEDQTKPDPEIQKTEVVTDEGDDTVFYTINAPVSIDGGPGFDTLVAIGTDLPDTFVITRDGIYGAGLYITFTGIESVELTTLAGDDTVYVLSTAEQVQTSVFMGLGSDAIYVTPSMSEAVDSNDLKGHSGVINHLVTSAADADYNNLEAHGISANVADDEASDIVFNTPTLITLEEGGAVRKAVYTARLTKRITAEVTVGVVVPSAPSQIKNGASVTVSPDFLVFSPGANWDQPRTVTVTVVSYDRAVEGNEVVFLGHNVVQLPDNNNGYDTRVVEAMPVRIIDRDENEIYVVEPDSHGLKISETGLGSIGKSVTYEIVLKPCPFPVSSKPVQIVAEYDSEQVSVSPASFYLTTATGCRQTVTVTSEDDGKVEGFHYTTVQHNVITENPVYKTKSVGYVSIQILDNEAPGVVVLESEGSTNVLEGGYTDTYLVYLTMAPEGEVTVTADVAKTYAKVSAEESKQVTVLPEQLTFTSSDYFKPQTVTVTAIDDSEEDDSTIKQFPSQPALAYQIQGPLTAGGGEAPEATGLLDPIMLPDETDAAFFPGIDNQWLNVVESEQVDTMVIQNTGGFLPTLTTLVEGRVTGMGMGADRNLAGEIIPGGVTYIDIETVVVNLGAAVDTVIVNGTHTGSTYLNAGKSKDNITVLGVDGPTYVVGGEGDDDITVGDENGLLVNINDVVAVIGGSGTDTLTVRNGGGNPGNTAGVLTQSDITGLGMTAARPAGSLVLQELRVKGSGGSFGIEFSFNATTYPLTFAVGVSAQDMEDQLQAAILPVGKRDTCGKAGRSRCTQAFKVDKVDDETYLVKYQGEVAGPTTDITSLRLDLSGVTGAEHEYLAGVDVSSRPRFSGVTYGEVESLAIDMGVTAKDVLNVRGTSIPTRVRTFGGDDTIAISSDAGLADWFAAEAATSLQGWMKYVESPLVLDMGTGSNRLMVSDSKGEAKANVRLLAGSIRNLAPADINYLGNFTRGISFWLSEHDDVVALESTTGADGETRTVTTVNAGAGKDTITVSLKAGSDGFAVVHGEEGNDVINATGSSLPLLLLGGADDDRILAGSSDDIIFGDDGFVRYGAAGSGYILGHPHLATAPLTGAVELPSVAFTDHCSAGGNDEIICVGASSEVVFGGLGNDNITTDSGLDVVLGDFGSVTYDEQGRVKQAATTCASMGGNDILKTRASDDIALGGTGDDTLETEDGDDALFGDHGSVEVVYLELPNAVGKTREIMLAQATSAGFGGVDHLYGGSGRDVLVGGADGDFLWGGSEPDVVFGDYGAYDSSVPGDFTAASSLTETEQDGGDDVVFGGSARDVLFGGQGSDTMYGEEGEDLMFGDHGEVTVKDSAGELEALSTAVGNSGKADTMYGGSEADLLVGGAGGDTIQGNGGEDTLFGDFGSYSRKGAEAADLVLVSMAETEYLNGNNDSLVAGSENDVVFGGQGEDEISGEGGLDTLFGDHGQVQHASNGDFEAASTSPLSGNSDTIFGGDNEDVVFGGVGDDTIEGNDAADVVFGDFGSFTAPAPGLSNTVRRTMQCLFTGETGGDDEMHGNDGDDVIIGGQGKDTITGNLGDDWILSDCGKVEYDPSNDGSDLRKAQSQTPTVGDADEVSGGPGKDVLIGGNMGDTLKGDADEDILIGDHGKVETSTANGLVIVSLPELSAGGDDELYGGAQDDVLLGGEAADTMHGGTGKDWLFGDHGEVTVAPSGVETLKTVEPLNGGDDTMHGEEEEDIMFGGAANDTMEGGDSADVLFGDFGSYTLSGTVKTITSIDTNNLYFGTGDEIYGGAGNDFVLGGQGKDTIQGDSGADWIFGDHGTIELNSAANLERVQSMDPTQGDADTIYGGPGRDYIFGGTGGDTIEGGEHNDVIFGDFGKYETLVPGALGFVSTSTAVADAGGDTVHGQGGDDYMFGGQGDDELSGGTGTDWIFGDHGRVMTVGNNDITAEVTDPVNGGGDDEIHGGPEDDILFGGAGNDDMHGGEDHDVMFGDHGKYRRLRGHTTYTTTETTSSRDGGDDEMHGNSGNDILFGGQGADNMTGDAGLDWMFGDHARVDLLPTGKTLECFDFDAASSGADRIHGGLGDDYIFGGGSDDFLYGDGDEDVVFGDFGKLEQAAPNSVSDRTFTAIATSEASGGADYMEGGTGDDVLVGQQGGDTIFGGSGRDMVFGDQAVVLMEGAATHRIKRAETIDPVTGLGGSDTIDSEEDEDFVFGGTGEDTIRGGSGGDVLLGDHGLFDASQAPDKQYTSIFTADADMGGADTIYGEEGDDFIIGQQGNDHIYGGPGQDDITGGHNVLHGSDGSDTIEGGADADVILGDNGVIGRDLIESSPVGVTSPFEHTKRWRLHPTILGRGFDDVRRSVQRFDDVDEIFGNDVVYGGRGADIIHGQRGDDVLSGDEGDDEIFGELGDDTLNGGDGDDVLLGDVGHVVRALNSDNGKPRMNPKHNNWHKDIVLEEPATVTSWLPTWKTVLSTPEKAAAMLQTDLLVAMGGYNNVNPISGELGTKTLAPTSGRFQPWETAMVGMRFKQPGNDELNGNDGDDILIGQRGDDELNGNDGEDLLYGDDVSSAYHYDACLPLVSKVVRVLSVEEDASHSPPLATAQFGTAIHIPVHLDPEQVTRSSAMRSLERAAIGTVLPNALLEMHRAVGVSDLSRTDGASRRVMRAFAGVVPDAARHRHMVAGNDVLNGGEGADVLVGDTALHHAMVHFPQKEMVELREDTAARWEELQYRFSRMSTDVGTYQHEEGTYSLPADVRVGGDTINGGSGHDMLAGDSMEVIVDVVWMNDMSPFYAGDAVEGVMRSLHDFAILASDMSHAVFEAHHAVVERLYASRRTGSAAPELRLHTSNDNLFGGQGNDVVVGDSLLVVAKAVLKHGREFNDGPNNGDRRFRDLGRHLQGALEDHVRWHFHPSRDISKGTLKRRFQHKWDSLPYTRWGADEVSGDEGADVLIGDFGTVYVNTFAGVHARPVTRRDFKEIDQAQMEYLRQVGDEMEHRVTGSEERRQLAHHRNQAMRPYGHIVLYHDKGYGDAHGEPDSGSMSDSISGGSGSDLLVANNAGVVVPVLHGTGRVINNREVKVVRDGRLFLPTSQWGRIKETLKDRTADRDELNGEGGVDFIYSEEADRVIRTSGDRMERSAHSLRDDAREVFVNTAMSAFTDMCFFEVSNAGVPKPHSPLPDVVPTTSEGVFGLVSPP